VEGDTYSTQGRFYKTHNYSVKGSNLRASTPTLGHKSIYGHTHITHSLNFSVNSHPEATVTKGEQHLLPDGVQQAGIVHITYVRKGHGKKERS